MCISCSHPWSQTWAFTKANKDKITNAQRFMERQMLHVNLIEWIRNKTKVRAVREEEKK